MKRLLAVLAVLTFAIAATAFASSGRVTCASVTTTTLLLASNGARASFAVTTSSGAGILDIAYGSTAIAGGSASYPLAGGGTFSPGTRPVYSGPVSVVSKGGGAVWACAQETSF